jgi:hypothetical protein
VTAAQMLKLSDSSVGAAYLVALELIEETFPPRKVIAQIKLLHMSLEHWGLTYEQDGEPVLKAELTIQEALNHGKHREHTR